MSGRIGTVAIVVLAALAAPAGVVWPRTAPATGPAGGANRVVAPATPATTASADGVFFVTEVRPYDDQLEVATGAAVTVRFSEPVNPATVNEDTFTLLLDGVLVPAAVMTAPGNLRATLDPGGGLAADAIFEVRLSSGIESAGGEVLDSFLSRFRTAPEREESRPIRDVSIPTSEEPAGSNAGTDVVPAGDVNGDGIDDLVAGAPGRPNAWQEPQAGAALVYLGSEDPEELSRPDLIFEGGSPGERAGVSVSANFDFNGDGRLDFLIGAEQFNRSDVELPGCEARAPCGAGRAYLVYFDPDDTDLYPNLRDPGIPDVIDLSRVGQQDGVPGVVFDGAAFGDLAGFSVAAGSRSGPGGPPDLLIGAPRNGALAPEGGAVYLVFHEPALFGSLPLDLVGEEVPGVQFRGGEDGQQAGFSVAFVGNVVGGGADFVPSASGDIGIGAPYDDPSPFGFPLADAGTVFLAESDDLDTIIIDVDSIGVTIPGLQILGTQSGEHLGWVVAAGGDSRVNGTPDLLIGAPDYDGPNGVDSGRVLHSSAVLPGFTLLDADQIGAVEPGVIWVGEAAGDRLGFDAAGLGDSNGDGYADVGLGAPLHDPLVGGTVRTDAGALYLAHGKPPATPAEGVIDVATLGTSEPGEALVGSEPGENVGASVAALGDADGDGDDDLASGAPSSDAGGSGDSGTTFLATDTETPPPGNCGPAGCTVADLATGAQITVPAGSLSSTLTLGVSGVLDPAGLPGPPPAGSMLLGAADFDPEGTGFGIPRPTIWIPVRDDLAAQVGLGEPFQVFRYVPSSMGWVDTGTAYPLGANPHDPSGLAGTGPTPDLHVFAMFLPDDDGDGWRDTVDNCPGIPNPGQEDGDADGAGDPCDNCSATYNPSQADADADGTGDACEASPVLWVSSDPADGADYEVIQHAVDAATVDGTEVRILPGLGVYQENVTIDGAAAVHLTGSDAGGGGAVIVDGQVSGPAITVGPLTSVTPVSLRNLQLRGTIGVSAQSDASMEDLEFRSITVRAVALQGGSHSMARIAMPADVDDGIEVSAGASLQLERGRLTGVTGTAVSVAGQLDAVNLLAAGCQDGIVTGSSADLLLRYATLTACSGIGVDNLLGGAVEIRDSILWGNGGGDLLGVSCGQVFRSDLGSVDCAGVNANLRVDPMLDPGDGYRPLAGSPVVDHGPAESGPSFDPCDDLDGGARVRDGDFDGVPAPDLGAYERYVAAEDPSPGEVAGLRWTDAVTLAWDALPGAGEFNLYRDLLSALAPGSLGTCRNDLDAVRTDTILTDGEAPAAGTGFSYLVTAEAIGLPEGTMGVGTCVERTNSTPCP